MEPFRESFCKDDEHGQRRGSDAAAAATAALKEEGIVVFAGPPSVSESAPYEVTGPRFYVSVTPAYVKQHGHAPALPDVLRDALWEGDDFELKNTKRLRGLGWTLAPSGSDPQQAHNDIWGGVGYPPNPNSEV